MLEYSLSHWLTFFSVAFILTLSPGPDLAFIMAQTIRGGRRSGFAAMLGIWGGTLLHIILAIIGLSAMVASSAAIFTLVKWGGAIYLIALGLSAFRTNHALDIPHTPSPIPAADGLCRIFGQGFIITLLNPKTGIFFLSFLPLFIVEGAGPVWMQLALHGLLLIIVAAMVEPLWIMLGERMTVRLRQSPRLIPWLSRSMGAVLIALGIRLAFETR